ncbi:MAG: hypothetical protein ISR65_06690 [Bacteriovoracaceae bacterium]|nr:hypothetical protein [Bacteriovoracaceae bacterium]
MSSKKSHLLINIVTIIPLLLFSYCISVDPKPGQSARSKIVPTKDIIITENMTVRQVGKSNNLSLDVVKKAFGITKSSHLKRRVSDFSKDLNKTRRKIKRAIAQQESTPGFRRRFEIPTLFWGFAVFVLILYFSLLFKKSEETEPPTPTGKKMRRRRRR